MQAAKLQNGTDVTNYVSAVVCGMTATETVGEKAAPIDNQAMWA